MVDCHHNDNISINTVMSMNDYQEPRTLQEAEKASRQSQVSAQLDILAGNVEQLEKLRDILAGFYNRLDVVATVLGDIEKRLEL